VLKMATGFAQPGHAFCRISGMAVRIDRNEKLKAALISICGYPEALARNGAF